MSLPNNCPLCDANLVGDKVWDHFKRQALLKGVNEAEAERYADDTAKQYGANREFGHWNRAIAIYDRGLDRTVAYKCPDCDERWSKE